MNKLTHRLAVLLCASLVIATSGLEAKTLRMAVISYPPTLGNPYGANGMPSAFVWFSLFDPLVRTDVNGNLEAALAVDWETVAPTRWRFHLRRDVVFSNGEPFNADAAAATLRWLMSDAARGMVVANEVQGISGVEVVDAYTMDIITDVPDAILPKRLTGVLIVAPAAWEALGPERFALEPAGTGPFRLVSWGRRQGRAEVVAHPQSWRAPLIDGILFYQIPEETALVQSLMSDQLDLVTTIAPDAARELEANGFVLQVSPTAQVLALAFNVEGDASPALDDVRVRTALNIAVNRRAITDLAMGGFAAPASQGASQVTYGYDPSLEPIPYEPEQAKALLAEAGYGEGLELTAEVVTGGNANASLIYQLVQQDLRQIGVDLELRTTVFPDWLRQYVSGTFDADLFSLAWNSEPYYDVIRPMEYYSCDKPNPFFCDRSVMETLERSGRELEPAARLETLRALSRRYRELAPSIFIIEARDISIVSPRVRNYRVRTRVPVYEELDLKP